MTNLITSKISNVDIRSQNVASSVVDEKIKSKDFIPEKPIQQTNSRKLKPLLPLSLITGGGILIYLGFKKPSAVKFFKRMIKDRCFKIERNIQEFSVYTEKLIDDSFDSFPGRVSKFRKEKFAQTEQGVNQIMSSSNALEVLACQDKAYDSVLSKYYSDLQQGASPFDSFMVLLSNKRFEISPQIGAKRNAMNLSCKDLTNIPCFRQGKHPELIRQAEDQLSNLSSSASSEMSRIEHDKFNSVINGNAVNMATAVVDSRMAIKDAKALFMESSFIKIRELLNLSKDFVPTYGKVPSLANYEKLTLQELCPQKISRKFNKLFEKNIYWDAVLNKDFNKINDRDIKELFYSVPPVLSVKDIGLMIDRLRLEQVVDNSLGKSNDDLYKILTAKLEFLYNKLTDFGGEELLKRCDEDFDHLSIPARKGKMFYVYDISRKLGYDTLLEMDKDFAKNNEDYIDSTIRKYIPLVNSNPELYFM